MRPYRNALLAAAYIIGIVLVLGVITDRGGEVEGRLILMLPMAMLSLLVLSVAVMAFLFGYEPVRLFIDGRGDEAVSFFWKMVATFAACASVFVVAYYLVSTPR